MFKRISNRLCRPGGTHRLFPAPLSVLLNDVLNLPRSSHLRLTPAALVNFAAGKESLRITDTAHIQGFGQLRHMAFANDAFGGAASDIDDQPLVGCRRQ